jgi:hypothetical protein
MNEFLDRAVRVTAMDGPRFADTPNAPAIRLRDQRMVVVKERV